ncbi:hypothetical protein D3C85_917440 [compost metagenome]
MLTISIGAINTNSAVSKAIVVQLKKASESKLAATLSDSGIGIAISKRKHAETDPIPNIAAYTANILKSSGV